MDITNRLNLSPAWVEAVSRNTYDKVGDYSCTQLISPVRLQILLSRYDSRLREDVIDRIWMLMGSAVHFILEQSKTKGSITEERFMIKICGKSISMKPDRLDPIEGTNEYHLKDFKITSVYAIKKGPKDDWIKQTNLYAYGMRLRGFPVTMITIETLLKDWRASDQKEALRNDRPYPPQQVVKLDVPVWPDERCRTFIEERVRLFEKSKHLKDSDLPRCSMGEQWANEDYFKVVKLGKTRSLPNGKFKTQGEANQFALTKEYPTDVAYVMGERIRCERFCPVKNYCNQYKEEHKQELPF